jgi:hypothetical protein
VTVLLSSLWEKTDEPIEGLRRIAAPTLPIPSGQAITLIENGRRVRVLPRLVEPDPQYWSLLQASQL